MRRKSQSLQTTQKEGGAPRGNQNAKKQPNNQNNQIESVNVNVSSKEDKEKIKKENVVSFPITEIISHLNTLTGCSYKASSKETQRHIKARLKEGYTVEDFKKVIDSKVADWGNDAKMQEYLRPSTLFGTKFESYLQQAKKAESRENQFEIQGF